MTSAFAKFHLPPQDLAAPTLFPAKREAFIDWLQKLPQANLGQTAKALYGASSELNRLQASPVLRLQLLEVLRPALHATSNSLRRHYLNQAIQLPEQAQQVARLTHVLHEQLATGYVLVAEQTRALDKQAGFSQPLAAVATAIHRGIVEHSQNLLRDFQLYRTPHPGCWATVHRLMQLAQKLELAHSVVADPQNGDSSIEAAYARALLLGSCRPNQLRQESLSKVFTHALGWTAAIALVGAEQAPLVINTDSDDGPQYREFAAIDRHCIGLDTAPLAQQLRAQAELPDPVVGGDESLSRELLLHLAQSWSSYSAREFVRLETAEPIEIAAGLTAAHHFVSGEIDFTQLLSDGGATHLSMAEENPFLQNKPTIAETRSPKDVWARPYTPNAGAINVSLEILNDDMHAYSRINPQAVTAPPKKERDKYRTQTAQRVNVSPGGLCIKWPPQSALQIRTGEIVGVREQAQKSWAIAVIRWIQLIDAGPRLGLELLSPTAVAYGARPINKTGPLGDYLRVLVLPEIKQIDQPTTLIVPRLAFRTGQKVSLRLRDKETQVQLTRKIMNTDAYSQYEFRRLGAGTKTQSNEGSGSNSNSGVFDNLWDNL